jgi:CheY-like chemotaxis protein
MFHEFSSASEMESAAATMAPPCEQVSGETVDAASTAVETPSLSILLAEDNEINQKVAIAQLQKAGHRVQIANNGREAVHILNGHAAFDIVLMDMHMPELDGLEATRMIRKMDGPAADLPIVALTAADTLSDIQACLDVGMDYFLVKPLRMEHLCGILSKLRVERVAK